MRTAKELEAIPILKTAFGSEFDCEIWKRRRTWRAFGHSSRHPASLALAEACHGVSCLRTATARTNDVAAPARWAAARWGLATWRFRTHWHSNWIQLCFVDPIALSRHNYSAYVHPSTTHSLIRKYAAHSDAVGRLSGGREPGTFRRACRCHFECMSALACLSRSSSGR